jgi:hypothetical protein
MRFRTAQMESWSARFASSTIWDHNENKFYDRSGLVPTILLLPRTKTVTVFVFAHSSMTSILSRVVPKVSSRTIPALPSLAAVRSSNRGTIRPPVAMAINYNPSVSHKRPPGPQKNTSISGPPTHRTAGRSFCISRWLASSSKPHWQMTRLAPVSFTRLIMSANFSFS